MRVHRPKVSTAGAKNSTSVFTALTTFRISVNIVIIIVMMLYRPLLVDDMIALIIKVMIIIITIMS